MQASQSASMPEKKLNNNFARKNAESEEMVKPVVKD